MPYQQYKPYFKLFANCIAVKGAYQSTICDLHRGNIQIITNELYDILIEYKNKHFDTILEDYDSESHNIITEYFSFLEEKQLGFWCSNPENYPDLNLRWDTPAIITNAIIDANAHSTHDYKSIVEQLSRLGCKSLQLRFYDVIALDRLMEIINATIDLRFNCIELFVKYSDEYSVESCKRIITAGMLSTIYVHSSPFTSLDADAGGYPISHIEKVIDSFAHCGIITQNYLVSNIPMFTEAQQHNTCLNRKISIDVNGDIKNCPSFSNSFGNISNTKLSEVVKNDAFKSKWFIKKDQISVCKDCEFRYVCSDCRAYLQNPDDEYSKPLKCSYNPYTATWD